MKVRTTNRKGRHLSTVRILQLLVEHGVETPDGLQRLAPGRLTASTINRHMHRLGYDHDRMTRQPPDDRRSRRPGGAARCGRWFRPARRGRPRPARGGSAAPSGRPAARDNTRRIRPSRPDRRPGRRGDGVARVVGGDRDRVGQRAVQHGDQSRGQLLGARQTPHDGQGVLRRGGGTMSGSSAMAGSSAGCVRAAGSLRCGSVARWL
jgi:hypothetical protein